MDLEGLPLSSLETINIYNQFDDIGLTESSVEFISPMLYICNPGAKIKTKVPRSADDDAKSHHYSFGYDSTNNDYKLLKLSIKYFLDDYETEIYSLKTDSWTKVVDFPHNFYPINNARYCEFLNGAIHWLSCNLEDDSYFVSSFYLSENKYTKLPLPQDDDQVTMADSGPRIISLEYDIVRLYVVGGMLCTLNRCGTKGYVLWGNKDHKDKTSWSKILTVPFETIPHGYYNPCALIKPLYVYESGEVLIGIVLREDFDESEKTQLVVFKDNRDLFQQITSHPISVISQGFVHVESLISPFHNN